MKKRLLQIVLIGIVLTFISCQNKQNGFEISAQLEGFSEDSKVVLSDRESGKVLDSSFVKNGSFLFKGRFDATPTELSIVVSSPDRKESKYTTLFIGNEDVRIVGNKKDFPAMLTIEGSIHQKLKSELEQKTEPYNVEYDNQIQKMIGIRQKGNWNDSLQTVYWGKGGVFNKIDSQILTIKKDFIERHRNSFFGIKLLNSLRNDMPKEYIVEQYDKVNPEFKATKYGKSLQTYCDNASLKNGDQFYNFTAENKNGKLVEFSSFFNDDRYVLLEFSSPHCGWCKKALPEIRKLADTKKESLKVITFNVDKDKEDWQKTNEENNVTWQSLWNKDGRYSESYIKYRVWATPTYYLFDSKGKVVTQLKGFDENMIASIEKQIR